MRPGLLCDIFPAQHPGDLIKTLILIKQFHRGHGPAVLYAFTHTEVSHTEAGDLGQMGNTEHLMGAGNLFQLFPNRLSYGPAYPCINLIKKERAHPVMPGQYLFNGQHYA